MSVFAAVSVGGCVATLVSSIRMVVKHQAPVRPIPKWVVPAALATLLITPIAVTAVPILGVTLAWLPGYLAYRGARRYATLTYPRRVTATLLESRLKPVLGDPWTGQALLIEYDPTNSADRANVAKVVIKIPRAVLPSKIVDRCKEVLTETFSGGKKKKWTASTADTVITFTPKVEIQDPPPLKHLKSVLQDNRALGADARVEVNEWDDVGEIAAFTGKASKELANVVASRIRQVHIEDLVHTRVPIANGSWVVTWDVTAVPTITARRSAFRDIIYKEPPERFIQSRAQAAEEYPNALFRVGLHPDGRVCTRTPIKEPNGLTTGATGGTVTLVSVGDMGGSVG